MRKASFSRSALLLIFFLANAATAEDWQTVAGFDSLGYWMVAADPRNSSVFYADAVQGRQLWKSVDGGVSWTATGLTISSASTVVVEVGRPAGVSVLHTIGLGTAAFKDVIARSVDGGITWTTRELPQSNFGVVNGGMAIDAERPDTLYVSYECIGFYECTQGGGLMRSTDGGRNWKAVLSDVSVHRVNADPVTTGIVYATTTDRVLRSVDGGSTWQPVVSQQSGWGLLLIDPTAGMTLYFVDRFATATWRSDDRGDTWIPVATRYPEEWAFYGTGVGAVDPTNRSVIVVSKGGTGVYRSLDSGATWQPLRNGLEDPNNSGSYVDIRNFAYAADGTLWASSTTNGLHFLRPTPAATPPTRRRAIRH